MDSNEGPEFALPGMIDNLLAALAIQYEGANDDVLRAIVVNSRPIVDAGVSYDNWDGGISGHDIHLFVPKGVFAKTGKKLAEIQKQLKTDMDLLVHCPGEFVQGLTVELDENTIGDWRRESGLLVRTNPVAATSTASDLDRIWHPGFLRVFITHKAEYKAEAAKLKRAMNYYGMSGFVAHNDVKPARKWQDEIERALQSMHVMVLLLTQGYDDSEWTDQETGVAIGRGVPIVPIRIDMNPYGFVGKIQALAGRDRVGDVKKPSRLAKDLLDLLLTNRDVHDDLVASVVARFEQSESYDQANDLVKVIAEFKAMPRPIVVRLEKAPKSNREVGGAFDVERLLPDLLKRWRRGQP